MFGVTCKFPSEAACEGILGRWVSQVEILLNTLPSQHQVFKNLKSKRASPLQEGYLLNLCINNVI